MSASKKSTIANNIKKYRQKLGISQDRLSKMADVTYNTIIKIESGGSQNPTIDTLSKIAKALGVSVDDLIKK
ncbi:MAG: helix-turn-helix transcriptional regulator [Candidatus Moranbacteria bacterium]|nr:helix-turn-helix transcriptional regulator [Candidatus Moranbacteria bacterium]